MLESRTTALLAIAVPTAVLPKSKAFNSPTTAVIPSRAFNSAAVDVTPSKMLSSAVVAVTPSIKLSSVAVAVTPSKMLSSAAVAETFVPPISKVVTLISPATVTKPFATVIKSVSSVCPIVLPLIRTSSISNEPPLINPVVVIADEPVSIVPNPEVILPEFKAPVVTVSELPAKT